jgi:hypothetical protein
LQNQAASFAEISLNLRESVEIRKKTADLQEQALKAQAANAKNQNLKEALEINLITEVELPNC